VGKETGMNAQTPIGPFVRPAILDDAEGIAKVHVKGWQEAYVGQLPQPVLDRQSVPARMRMWSGLLQEPAGRRWTFVAIDPAAGIVGFVGGVRAARPTIHGPAFQVPVLYVLQSHLRRGLGRKLMHALGQAMTQHGSGEVALWSLASNKPARAFYEAIGGRLVSALTERDHNRVALAGYRWRSAAELAEKSSR
jgi:GNAT superfamily N-acetyltransferase